MKQKTILNSNATQGLSSKAALERLQSEGYNELPQQDRRNIFRIFFEIIRQPMFALLVGGGVVYLLLGDQTEAFFLLIFACLSVFITIVQESRSENVLASLRNLASPRAVVVRDGKRITIAGREVVRDDVLVISEGDRIAADATLISSQDLLVDESLLTGESVPVTKLIVQTISNENLQHASHPMDENQTTIFAGSLVVRGSGIACVKTIGINTEMGKIGRALSTIETEQPHLQTQLKNLIRNFSIIGGIAGLSAVILFGVLRGSWLEASLSGIALGMSLLPEEFPLVMTVFMAMGAWRISQARVLTRRASSIESLGATTVLCTDKTGTLTENRMTVVALQSENKTWLQSNHTQTTGHTEKILSAAFWASQSQPTDPMDVAIHALAEKEFASELQESSLHTIHTYGLRPDCFAVANITIKNNAESATLYAKGALEAVLALCHLSPDQTNKINQQAEFLASNGIRVLAVAEQSIPKTQIEHWQNAQWPDSLQEFNLNYIGLIGFADPLRSNVVDAVAECHSAGIKVIMITGDYPSTARAIGGQAGITSANVLTGDDVEKMSDQALAHALKNTTIFARIKPNQKLRLVQILKANDEVVAMTGDGVNDAPAIKAAHIGISMGGRGTDVAREASSIVLLDDDFSSIVKTIRLGRRIYDNLRKAIEYIIAVHIPIAGLALLPLLFGLPLILTPIHIAFLEMVIDPACSVIFEAETEEDNVMRRPPRNAKTPLVLANRVLWAVIQGLAVLVSLALMLFWATSIHMPADDIRTFTFTSLVIMNIGLILVNRTFSTSLMTTLLRPNRALWILISVVIAVLTVSVYWQPARMLFHFGVFHWHLLLIGIAASIATLLILEVLKSNLFDMDKVTIKPV
jgi:Ca2+-transporting ATPase